jgi:hypothetical protein
MPRIPREEHAAIRHRVDIAGQKVAEVAAAYGCTPANIYAILARLRRQDGQSAGDAVPSTSVTEASPAFVPADAASADLFAGLVEAKSDPAPLAAVAPIAAEPPATAPDPPLPFAVMAPEPPPSPVVPQAPVRADHTKVAPRPPAPASAPGTGKAGYALLMRTSDGEEAVNPFRSLDELLTAAKPILRTAARSPEPIWFSIQQVDLDALEDGF